MRSEQQVVDPNLCALCAACGEPVWRASDAHIRLDMTWVALRPAPNGAPPALRGVMVLHLGCAATVAVGSLLGRLAPAPADAGPLADLSKREREVAVLLVQGRTNKQIARTLDVAEVTVKVHLKAINRKLGTTNRTQAALAIQRALDVTRLPAAVPAEAAE